MAFSHSYWIESNGFVEGCEPQVTLAVLKIRFAQQPIRAGIFGIARNCTFEHIDGFRVSVLKGIDHANIQQSRRVISPDLNALSESAFGFNQGVALKIESAQLSP